MLDSGTLTIPEKENPFDETSNLSRRTAKPYSYNVFNIDSTSSAIVNKSSKLNASVDEESENSSIIEKAVNESSQIRNLRDIYFNNEFITPELRTAINLLEKSQSYIYNALQNIKEGRRKESDEYIMEFKQFLPELFCCRNISESFGAVINAIHNAMLNMKGHPLSENQIFALHEIITALLREPAMSFEKAVDYVSNFEDADFEVESIGLESLLNLIEKMNQDDMELING